jgi:hypothetical protein
LTNGTKCIQGNSKLRKLAGEKIKEMKKEKVKNDRRKSLNYRRINQKHLVPLCPYALMLFVIPFCLCGCSQFSGYSNDAMFPEDVSSIYVEMFDNKSFWRDVEYDLSTALAKRIEADTPYKIVSSRDRADTVISGQISSIGRSSPTTERETGRPLEFELELRATVNWKNLKTGELLINRRSAMASASYSSLQQQDFDYASSLAANKLAQRIVELMEKRW